MPERGEFVLALSPVSQGEVAALKTLEVQLGIFASSLPVSPLCPNQLLLHGLCGGHSRRSMN